MDPALGSSDHKHAVVSNIHSIDPLLRVDSDCSLLTRLSSIPVFDGLVPASRDEHRSAVVVEGLYAANGLVMSSYGDCLVRLCMARAKVENLDKLVRASTEDLRSVL